MVTTRRTPEYYVYRIKFHPHSILYSLKDTRFCKRFHTSSGPIELLAMPIRTLSQVLLPTHFIWQLIVSDTNRIILIADVQSLYVGQKGRRRSLPSSNTLSGILGTFMRLTCSLLCSIKPKAYTQLHKPL